ncbi:putative B3 domain-containing protein [Citrus sinensis]|uniref:B3 domain-containing protein n=1 Tax=Citrus sinensis TaxID=2711 RepID=A0ACB8JH68_CITSI|nr:putative B3 domain-containing protein [Citrus sinensis]
MAKTNTYEEARKKRLEENSQRLQELGIEKISKTLSQLSKSVKKSPQAQRHLPKFKSESVINIVEPRRSSRARNSVVSYRDDLDIDLHPLRKRSRSNSSSWASYLARPLEEVKMASYEERARALKSAEQLQSSLQSGYPSFIKSMVRSHVYSCFWLFCKQNLPKTVTEMVLEDENGREFEAVYIGQKKGLSGGWRAFALHHKLDDGDALVFELVEQKRFKIYIIRASSLSSQEHDADAIDNGFTSTAKKTTRRMELDVQPKRKHENEEVSSPQELQWQNMMESGGTKVAEPEEESGSAPKKEKVVSVEEKDKCAQKTPKSLRKKTN